MAWEFVCTSCMDDLGNVNPTYLLRNNPRFVALSGDLIYSNMGTPRAMAGVQFDPDIFWREGVPGAPVNARSLARLQTRLEAWAGDSGLPNWAAFWAQVRAAGIPVYGQADDHDFLGDNWDHTITVLSGTFPDSYVGTNLNNGAPPYGQVINAAGMTLADVLYTWRIRNQGWAWYKNKYLSNPASPGFNGDIPANMVGTAQPSDYPIDYFYKDFGPNGEPGGSTIRVIWPDSISYKSVNGSAENASKQFWGAVQTAWAQALMLDAKQRNFGMVIIISTKDVYGADNNDGMGNFVYWRDNSFLTFIEANNIPVCVISGDKHLAHTSIGRKSRGDITDLVVHCASPFGSRHSALAQHSQLVWAANRADQPVYERVMIDATAGEVILSTVDGYDNTVLNMDAIPFGQRLPSRAYRRALPQIRSRGGFLKTAITVTASPFVWQNNTGAGGYATIVGGTISDVSVARADGAYESIGTPRQVQLNNGEQVQVTYSVAPTMNWYPQGGDE